jgi:hypothetical protein
LCKHLRYAALCHEAQSDLHGTIGMKLEIGSRLAIEQRGVTRIAGWSRDVEAGSRGLLVRPLSVMLIARYVVSVSELPAARCGVRSRPYKDVVVRRVVRDETMRSMALCLQVVQLGLVQGLRFCGVGLSAD